MLIALVRTVRVYFIYNSFRMLYRVIFIIQILTSCASASWHEGWHTERELILVGFGKPIDSDSKLQRQASAQEAAVLDAFSHFPQYCPRIQDDTPTRYKIENQRKRKFFCSEETCRVQIVIETPRTGCKVD